MNRVVGDVPFQLTQKCLVSFAPSLFGLGNVTEYFLLVEDASGCAATVHPPLPCIAVSNRYENIV
jgi:hypothetical protein